MPTLTEELAEIKALPKADSVQRRSKARKTQYQRLRKQVEDLQAKPPWELNRRELDRKAAELDRALLLSQALSARHVELMAEHATVVAELEEQGLRVEEDHLALIDIVAELLEQQQLSVEIAVLKDELHGLSTFMLVTHWTK